MDATNYLVAILVGIFVLVSARFLVIFIIQKKKNLPPGPMGLPYLGYLPFLGSKPYKKLMKLSNTYGKVFGLSFGRQYTVMLGDFQSIKEAFSKNDFSARPANVFKFTDKYHNFVNMRGTDWQEQYRFTIRALRDLGMGKGRIEEVIKEQIFRVITELEAIDPDKTVNVEDILSTPIDNVIYSMICGKTFDHGDPTSHILHQYQIYSQRYFASLSLAGFFPFLKPLLLKYHPLLKGTFEAIKNMEESVSEEIKSHENLFDENYLGDYMDYFLKESKSKPNSDTFTKNILNGSSQFILLGGSETSRVTMEWGLMLLAKHQDIQEKVYQEIVKVIGTENNVTWSDRESLPYTNAVLNEIQRRKTLAPLNVLRCAQKDSQVGGFDIEKETTVIANLWSVHMDPNYWTNPKEFNPERFLTREGDTLKVKHHENFIPFSYGQRMCPGSRLATMQLSIMMPSLLQRFRILPPHEGQDFTSELRVVLKPLKPFVRFVKR